jgi:hypothetical protein
MKYQIWREGYEAGGKYVKAELIGEAEGLDFNDACDNFAEGRGKAFVTFPEPFKVNYRKAGEYEKEPVYWCSRLFDNEKDARELYG